VTDHIKKQSIPGVMVLYLAWQSNVWPFKQDSAGPLAAHARQLALAQGAGTISVYLYLYWSDKAAKRHWVHMSSAAAGRPVHCNPLFQWH
jgi:hypothetical protein